MMLRVLLIALICLVPTVAYADSRADREAVAKGTSAAEEEKKIQSANTNMTKEEVQIRMQNLRTQQNAWQQRLESAVTAHAQCTDDACRTEKQTAIAQANAQYDAATQLLHRTITENIAKTTELVEQELAAARTQLSDIGKQVEAAEKKTADAQKKAKQTEAALKSAQEDLAKGPVTKELKQKVKDAEQADLNAKSALEAAKKAEETLKAEVASREAAAQKRLAAASEESEAIYLFNREALKKEVAKAATVVEKQKAELKVQQEDLKNLQSKVTNARIDYENCLRKSGSSSGKSCKTLKSTFEKELRDYEELHSQVVGRTTVVKQQDTVNIGNILVAPGQKTFRSAVSVIETVITTAVRLAGAAALVLFMLAGARYVLSHGDDGEIGKAKDQMIVAAIGLAVVLGAYLLVTFVQSVLYGTGL